PPASTPTEGGGRPPGRGHAVQPNGVGPRTRPAAGTATLAELVCRPAAVFSRPAAVFSRPTAYASNPLGQAARPTRWVRPAAVAVQLLEPTAGSQSCRPPVSRAKGLGSRNQ